VVVFDTVFIESQASIQSTAAMPKLSVASRRPVESAVKGSSWRATEAVTSSNSGHGSSRRPRLARLGCVAMLDCSTAMER